MQYAIFSTHSGLGRTTMRLSVTGILTEIVLAALGSGGSSGRVPYEITGACDRVCQE
jgi:hypothetical protein